MGEVIRRDAAAVDILADARTTFERGVARGGDWQTAVEARLSLVLRLAELVRGRIDAARRDGEPLVAALMAENERADALVARISDEVWNLVGRPAQDAALDILFPGGFAFYTDGALDEQPDRMELLAELIELGIHPKVPAARATAFATELRAGAAALRARVDAARPVRIRSSLADRMHTAIARTGQIALANLKRAWKADGKSESEIHSVIPDRPGPAKKPAPPAS